MNLDKFYRRKISISEAIDCARLFNDDDTDKFAKFPYIYISSDEDDDTNSTKEDWDSQITVSSVLKKDIVDRVLVDNLIVELKKAKRDFDKQKKPAQDYSSEQA